MKIFHTLKQIIENISGNRNTINIIIDLNKFKKEFKERQKVIVRDVLPVDLERMPFKSERQFQMFCNLYPELLYKYHLKKLSLAIKENQKQFFGFYVGNTGAYTKIDSCDYEGVLDKMIESFSLNEMYTEAAIAIKIRHTLIRSYVNRIILESTQNNGIT